MKPITASRDTYSAKCRVVSCGSDSETERECSCAVTQTAVGIRGRRGRAVKHRGSRLLRAPDRSPRRDRLLQNSLGQQAGSVSPSGLQLQHHLRDARSVAQQQERHVGQLAGISRGHRTSSPEYPRRPHSPAAARGASLPFGTAAGTGLSTGRQCVPAAARSDWRRDPIVASTAVGS